MVSTFLLLMVQGRLMISSSITKATGNIVAGTLFVRDYIWVKGTIPHAGWSSFTYPQKECAIFFAWCFNPMSHKQGGEIPHVGKQLIWGRHSPSILIRPLTPWSDVGSTWKWRRAPSRPGSFPWVPRMAVGASQNFGISFNWRRVHT